MAEKVPIELGRGTVSLGQFRIGGNPFEPDGTPYQFTAIHEDKNVDHERKIDALGAISSDVYSSPTSSSYHSHTNCKEMQGSEYQAVPLMQAMYKMDKTFCKSCFKTMTLREFSKQAKWSHAPILKQEKRAWWSHVPDEQRVFHVKEDCAKLTPLPKPHMYILLKEAKLRTDPKFCDHCSV